MKSPWEWLESDIQELISSQVQESVNLDYKACKALDRRNDKTKVELSKDVAAFANSAGGVIVYGVLEDKHFPTNIDDGYDPNDISKEWIEQVINSNIQRRIDGIRINQVQLPNRAPGKVLYVVSIPQSPRAPHMAADHRFYKRFNFESVPMEEYEVRDVARRQESPDLHLDVEVRVDQNQWLLLAPYITNRSAEPAFHAVLRLFLPEGWLIKIANGWVKGDFTYLNWDGHRPGFHTYYQRWMSPPRSPILEGERYETGVIETNVGATYNAPHYLAYELRAPKMETKLNALLITVNNGAIRVYEKLHTLVQRL